MKSVIEQGLFHKLEFNKNIWQISNVLKMF